MKPEKSTLGGFEQPTETWHSFEIGEDVGFLKERDEDGNTLESLSDTISFPCEVIESEEKGRRSYVSCDLTKKGGRTACARFLYFCGLAGKLEKQFKMDQNVTEIEWGEKYINPESDKCTKVIKEIISKATGCSFDGEIKHSEYKKKTYANIVDLAAYGKGEKKKTEKAESKTEGGAPADKSGGGDDDDVAPW